MSVGAPVADPAADVPDGLAWHYTDGPGLLAILATHTLWATAAPFLNDREEVRLGGRLLAERILETGSGGDPALTRELAERVSESSERGEGPGPGSAYILSASSAPDSLAMWRLYGGVRESYALGLDPAADLAVLATGEVELVAGRRDGLYLYHQGWRPVRYRPEEQRALVDTALTHLGGLAEVLGGRPRDGEPRDEDPPPPPEVEARVAPFLDAMQEALLLVKHEGFADERETRYAVVLVAGDGPGGRAAEARLLSYRASAYGLAPYVRLTGADPARPGGPVVTAASPLPVRAVAVSPSPHGAESTGSVRRALLAHGYDVPVHRSAIPFRS
ncbi:hypothetical protein [Phycicoccus flavus]|uniref:DUF2971 domain-containing protein n=1 Tax=Phycicoccus flavus TaxID=2502783 RepID=A0A8T6R782_9MICO|nr:hypothetical protein [Phycicoccus flavus]NHA69504.1 hypothetical protein [Phycicoccus flavus]